MDQNQYNAMVESTKRFAMLAEALGRNASNAIERQEKSAADLQQTAINANTQLQASVGEAGDRLERVLNQAVERCLAPGAQQFDAATRDLVRHLQQAGEAARGDQAQFASGLRTLLRKANALGWLSVGLLVLGGFGLLYYQAQAYRDARERTRAAEVEATIAEAMKRAHVTSCGGHPCLKLDQETPRWGKGGEYVLLDIAPSTQEQTSGSQ
ncbi:hypothetical protein [Marilutibacter maris]|uniref:hypothetical protein n=1 Tax=Marilutibacter maris TaxID=1605891 RepID=UPI0011AE195F|nr:hypothetical protein [Lysobacter maris]